MRIKKTYPLFGLLLAIILLSNACTATRNHQPTTPAFLLRILPMDAVYPVGFNRWTEIQLEAISSYSKLEDKIANMQATTPSLIVKSWQIIPRDIYPYSPPNTPEFWYIIKLELKVTENIPQIHLAALQVTPKSDKHNLQIPVNEVTIVPYKTDGTQLQTNQMILAQPELQASSCSLPPLFSVLLHIDNKMSIDIMGIIGGLSQISHITLQEGNQTMQEESLPFTISGISDATLTWQQILVTQAEGRVIEVAPLLHIRYNGVTDDYLSVGIDEVSPCWAKSTKS